MKVSSIKERTYQNQNTLPPADGRGIARFKATKQQNLNPVAFKSAPNSNFTKKMWLQFRKLSDYMKQPSEMTNALIAMIGTGGIAPFAIMCSPKKKCHDEQDKKIDKDKKFFQALRQPVSAFLAFAFQVPTTIGIAMGLNYLTYEKQYKFFDDKILNHLIPDKKYLRRQAINAMDENAKSELKETWKEELKIAENIESIKAELKEQKRKECEEVNLEISEEKLEKYANNKKRQKKFIAEKMAEARHNRLIDEKVQELSGNNYEIKDTDLVTENYQKLAKQKYKEEFAQLRKDANLSWFDKFIETMGFSNKKLNELGKNTKELTQEKGLILIKQDIDKGKLPDILNDKNARLKKFVENRISIAKKLHANKIFWLSLCTNLFMVAFSCVALNWLHPKFANLVDNAKEKRAAHKASEKKKVEVRV